MDDRHPDTLTDTAIEREIRTVLDVEPSPEFLARVRTSIIDLPMLPRFRWVTPAACALAAVLVVVLVSLTRQDATTADLKVSTTAAPAADLKIGPTETTASASKATARATASAVVPTFRSIEPRLAPREPEVLISPDDAKAFQEFVAGVRDARFEILPDEPELPATSNMVADLSIPPIVIEPLDPSPAVKN